MNKYDDSLGPHYQQIDFSNEFLNEFDRPVVVGLPHPVHKPLADTNDDLIQQYHKDLSEYAANFSTVIGDVKKGRYSAQPIYSGSYATTSGGILNLYRDMIKSPIRPYKCDYNPYYSTGLLSSFFLGSDPYLLTADIKNDIRVSNLSNHWHNDKLNLKTKITDPICGMSAALCKNEMFLLTRQINALKLMHFKEDTQCVESKWDKTYTKLIIDAQFNQFTNKIGYIDDSLSLFTHNLDKNVESNVGKAFGLQDMIKFEFIDENQMGILNQNSVTIIDFKCGTVSNKYKHELTNCNKLCAFKINDNYIYITSKHLLIRLDMRMLKNAEYCTHFMKSAPCYMDVNGSNLCISSQCDEKYLFIGDPISSLPIKVPTLKDAFKEFRMKNDYFSKIRQIERRFAKSTTGIKLITQNNKVFLYSANYLGDLFRHKIQFDHAQLDNNDAVDCFDSWTGELQDHHEDLHLNDVVNAANARFLLHKKVDARVMARMCKKSDKAEVFVKKYDRIYSSDNRDELTANFAAIWETDQEERDEGMQLVPEVQAFDKVTDWMERHPF